MRTLKAYLIVCETVENGQEDALVEDHERFDHRQDEVEYPVLRLTVVDLEYVRYAEQGQEENGCFGAFPEKTSILFNTMLSN